MSSSVDYSSGNKLGKLQSLIFDVSLFLAMYANHRWGRCPVFQATYKTVNCLFSPGRMMSVMASLSLPTAR